MCDSLKEPHWLTDQTSKDEIKKNIEILPNDWKKLFFISMKIVRVRAIGLYYGGYFCRTIARLPREKSYGINFIFNVIFFNVMGVPV